MTEAEKNELKTMLDAGFITIADYNAMMGEEQPVARALPPLQEAAPLAPQDEPVWHIVVNSQSQGPFDKQALKGMLATRQLTRVSSVWREGMSAWMRAETVAELNDLWAKLPPPVPTVAPDIAASVVAPLPIEKYKEAKALFDNKKHNEAYPLFKTLAAENYAPAQHMLGQCYYYGQGIAQDYAKAMELYFRAAEQGDIDAQASLANAYNTGKGVAKDDAKAVEWGTKAALQGHVAWQHNLANAYSTGKGVAKNDAKAVEWYLKAAEQGLKYSQYSLGCAFRDGVGVAKDLLKAREWLLKAAEQGFDRAQHKLGDIFLDIQDYDQAKEWYSKAAAQGNWAAEAMLEEIEKWKETK